MLVCVVSQLVTAPSAHAGYYAKVTSSGWGTAGDISATCTGSFPQVFSGGEGYLWVDDLGSPVCNDTLTDTQFAEQTDELVAAEDEATGAVVPTDIATVDAQAGTSFWDSLASAGELEKGTFLDFLQTEGVWPAWDAIASTVPEVALVAGVGYIGWKVGSAIASFLGISPSSAPPPSDATQYLQPGGVTYCGPGTYLPSDQGATSCGKTVPTSCSAVTECVVSPVKVGADTWMFEFSTLGGSTWAALVEPCYKAKSLPTNSDGAAMYVKNTTAESNGSSDASNGYAGEDNFSPVNGCPTGTASNPGGPVDVTVYTEPVKVTSLPGPGQSLPSPMPTTVTTSPPAVQPEAQLKSAAQTCLTSPSAPCGNEGGVNDYVCHTDGQACYGSASPSTGTGTITLPAITTNETYSQYKAALQAAGLLGAITQVTLSDAEADPTLQPDAVVRSSPAAGSQVAPDTSVAVYTNPDSVAGSGIGAPVGPSLPGINTPTGSTPCSVFPFGIPCWVHDTLAGTFQGDGTAPTFAMNLPDTVCSANPNCRVSFDMSNVFGINLNSIMAVVRPVLLVLSLLGLALWLGGMALGGSTSGGGDEGD